MHPPQWSLPSVIGDVALNEAGLETARLELSNTPCAGEKPSFIRHEFGLENVGPLQSSFGEFHGMTVTSGMGTTKCPPHSRIY
jgi:hypothetical protein